MSSSKTLEILQSVIRGCFGAAVVYDAPLASQINDPRWADQLKRALQYELDVELTVAELQAAALNTTLAELVETRLTRHADGRSIVDIYAEVERIVRDELCHEIDYHWHAAWIGDLLKASDSLEDVEIVISMENAFAISIPDRDVQEMYTVGQTARYLWRRLLEQGFTLRQRPDGVCDTTFVFHELRRALMMYGGVSRRSVRLDARIGYLLPTQSLQFLKHVQHIFGVEIPQGNLITRTLGLQKRTTIRELTEVIVSSR
ncbi:MAG TPA: hypothetical protein VGW58_03310 [Pyrinomonadaceae bacterium]|nr:hypothetical protein [Pyrinomonadaceae bacterium]